VSAWREVLVSCVAKTCIMTQASSGHAKLMTAIKHAWCTLNSNRSNLRGSPAASAAYTKLCAARIACTKLIWCKYLEDVKWCTVASPGFVARRAKQKIRWWGLTADFRAGCSSCSMTSSFVTTDQKSCELLTSAPARRVDCVACQYSLAGYTILG